MFIVKLCVLFYFAFVDNAETKKLYKETVFDHPNFLLLTTWSRIIFEKLKVSHLVRNSLLFMASGGTLPC
jgi:hypothetical protein